MTTYPSDVAFTPAVKSLQEHHGSRESYARMEQRQGWETQVTPDLKAFLGQQDMFYLGTANSVGQPYIQYRGGPRGFLKVLNEKTLGFADFGGNRQFISVGNLSENSRAFIFLIDYQQRRRIKIWGTARVVENDPELLDELQNDSYPGRVERAILFEIDTWDMNCPQHIHQRYPRESVEPIIKELQGKIEALEAELARLKS